MQAYFFTKRKYNINIVPSIKQIQNIRLIYNFIENIHIDNKQ